MMRIEPEEGLIEACLAKDEAAWARFVERYSPLISIAAAKCLQRCGLATRQQEIDDIRQDVFASIWESGKLAAVRDRSSIAAWLAIVASNETLAYLNRKGVENRLQPISLNMKLGRKELLDILPCRGGPGEELAKKDLCERLVRAVGTLPRKEMLIMKLILFHDKKYREIAEMLNMPKGTVSNYMKRAKGRLKIILKDY